jgi:hypothetical protein
MLFENVRIMRQPDSRSFSCDLLVPSLGDGLLGFAIAHDTL